MLKVEHLSHSFKKVEVLHDISLELREGIYGLLGPNGSGKTTLMRCITGVLHPTKGAVQAPDTLGYLPQRFGIFRELTAYEALAYFATLKKIPKEQQRDAVMTSLTAIQDIIGPRGLKEINWDRLAYLATAEDEAKASALNEFRYAEFIDSYRTYVRRWRGCENSLSEDFSLNM